MFSQVLEGVADLISSSFLLIGLQSSKKGANQSHPFGYGREIYFWSLISALVMFGISATLSFYLGFERFNKPEQIKNINFAFFILIVTVFTNGYGFFLSLKRLLRKRSIKGIIQIFYRSSLVETKTTFILDLLGALASILGIAALAIYQITGDYRYDGLGAMVIGITQTFFAYLLIMGIRDLMVGRSAPLAVEERIKNAAKNIKEVEDVLGIKTMHIGAEKLLVNIDVHLSSKLTTEQIEKLIDDIKAEIRKEVPNAKHIQIELETPEGE